MTPLVWVAILMLLGLAVMVLEVFIPSGGILGFVSLTAVVAAVATAFLQVGTAAGMAVLAVAVIAVPGVLALAFRWFPDTPLGRRVLPPPPDPADVIPDAARRRRLRELVGRNGLAVNELLPWGTVDIGGTIVEAMSESGPIASGSVIEVVGAQGAALIVRRVEPAARPAAAAEPEHPDGEPVGAGQGGGGPESRLSPTLEAFEFEQFDPPRA